MRSILPVTPKPGEGAFFSLNHLLATPKLEETRISEGGSRRIWSKADHLSPINRPRSCFKKRLIE
jgi:hypothetical protein